ncbi:MAG TPA: SH3 domain-containing protein [Chloroflexi bacterium]|nr:SH3 domain-containing protein [Chloroflexota bacterium]
MLSKRVSVALFGFVLVVLMACSFSVGAQRPPQQAASQVPPVLLTAAAQTVIAAQNQGKPTAFPPAVLTAAAGTAMAALTQNAPPATSAALPPTETPTPSPTASPTPTVVPTPTPSTPMISVSVNTNCRTGPGDAYDRVGALLVGETAEVLARDPYGQFWYIPNPDRPGSKCWVWGQYATVTGETASLPVFTPPPTPTPVADFVIKGITVKDCSGADAFFIEISNTGDVPWQSFSMQLKNLTTSANGGASGDVFSSTRGTCSLVYDLSSIPPGGGAYIAYNGGIGDHTQRIRFTVTLYAEDGQQGASLTRVIEYRP